MAYSVEEIERIFDLILERIEEGEALRSILKDNGMPSTSTFYIWLESNETKSKQYARACELRADSIFDEIIEIADDSSYDVIVTDRGEVENKEFVSRSRLRVDARKWIASKLNPKKYGDKIDHTSGGEKLPMVNFQIVLEDDSEDKAI